MPQYIWEDIFSILNVLVPGVIMALFAAYYQNRRKWEIKIEGQLAIERIDWMYKLLGMVMFSHCTRAYVELDNLICKQLKHFSLTYRRHRVRRAVRGVKEKMMCHLDRCARMPNIRGRFCHMLLILSFDKEYRNFLFVMKEVPNIMRYVHFSDRYSPQEYFELKRIPSSEEVELFGKVFMAQMHRS